MEKKTEGKWEEWEERHKREKSEKSKGIYADLAFCTLWGITIAYSLVIYSWQGYAELQNQATPESTYFNMVAVTLLVAFSLIVTVLYLSFKSGRRKTD